MYTIKRSEHNPLLQPNQSHAWESIAALNGCPIQKDGITYMLYRAIGRPDLVYSPDALSSIVACATSHDGNHFTETYPLIKPSEEYDKFGCEDPRVTFFEGKYYIFYTALSVIPFQASGIKVAVGISDDLRTIKEKHLVTPFNAKAMTLFPERVNGKVTALFTIHTDLPPAHIVVVQADNIEDFWNENFWNEWYKTYQDHTFTLERTPNDHCEVGAQPVLTDAGWLIVYSHTQHYFEESKRIFGIEAILLDRNDPKKVLGKTKSPMIVPETSYEQYGLVPRIVFPSGALIEGNRLDVYYGGADTVCAKFSVSLSDLLSSMKEGESPLLKRSDKNPILLPLDVHSFEERAVFNPAAIEIDGTVYILYRAMSMDNTSTVGLAVSKDGMAIDERLPNPIYIPREQFEQKLSNPTGNSGCEDPRITRVGDTLYMLYTAYNGVTPPAVAITHISVGDFLARNFDAWSKPRLLSPSMIDDKDACLVAEPFKDGYLVLHRIGHQICGDYLQTLGDEGKMLNRCIEILRPRNGMWDGLKVGISGPPIMTDKGLLLFYHGVSEFGVYRVGAVLLDKDEPTTVLGRTVEPLFEPQEKYEIEGQIHNVVFPCGQVVRDDTIYMYYGGGDSVIGVATCSLSKLLDILLPKEL